LKRIARIDPGRLALVSRHLAWRLTHPRPPVLREPIFMVGCPRSGTGVSVHLFGTHPWVAHWTEATRTWDPRGFDDPEADHHRTAEDVTERERRRLHAWFEWFRQTHGKPRFANKNPRSSVRIDFIRAVFPDAYYIHVIRDGRAVVSSLLQRMEREPWRKEIPFGDFCKPPDWRRNVRSDPAEQAALQWREIVRHVRDRRFVLGERYVEYKYEDLCEDPRAVLGATFRAVGLPAEDEHMTEIPARLTNMNDRSIDLLTPAQVETIEALERDLLAELGYRP
jgi:hypothetical protein